MYVFLWLGFRFYLVVQQEEYKEEDLEDKLL